MSYDEHLISMAGGDGEPEPLDLDAIQAIPDSAVEAAAEAWIDNRLRPGGWDLVESMRAALEAANPTLLDLVREQQARIEAIRLSISDLVKHFRSGLVPEDVNSAQHVANSNRAFGADCALSRVLDIAAASRALEQKP